MVGMIGVEGYVLGRTDIRRQYEASGNDYVQMMYSWDSHKILKLHTLQTYSFPSCRDYESSRGSNTAIDYAQRRRLIGQWAISMLLVVMIR